MAVPFSDFFPNSCLESVGVSKSIIHTCHWNKSTLCVIRNIILGIQFKNVRDLAAHPSLRHLK